MLVAEKQSTERIFNKIKIKDFFKDVESKIGKIELNEFYDVPFSVFIKNEFGEKVKIKRIIKKFDKMFYFKFSDDSDLTVGSKHLFINKFAKDLKEGDTVKTINGFLTISEKKEMPEGFVYDFEIDSDSHLYSTPNGVIHHNSGKSLILAKLAGENIKNGGISYIVDTEDAVNPVFAKVILKDQKGEIVNKIQRIDTIDTIEQLRTFLINLAEKKIAMKNSAPIFIGIDSVSQLSSEKEMEDAKSGSGARDMTKAQAMRGLFRVVNRYLRPANMTIVALSQTSSAIGGFGNPVTAANHGGGLKFASSLRLWITSGKEILDSAGIPIGVRMNFKVEKNRIVSKGRKASINLSFKKGIQKWSGLLEILAANDIISMSTKDIKKTTKITFEGEEFSAKKLDEWIETKGGEDVILGVWQQKLDEIYANFSDDEVEDLDEAPEEIEEE